MPKSHDVKLECFPLEGTEIDIRPAERTRAWMDDTPGRFAYRCLPLSIANSHGWVLRCNEGFTARWNGGPKPEDVEVSAASSRITGHFGFGILTFGPGVIFRTSPGFNLWVTGPVNRLKDGIQPLSGAVESDWLPLPFTMNWRFTRPDFEIRFEKGEPYCHIFPVPRGQLERIQPEIRDLGSEPELERQYKYAHFKREFPKALKTLKGDDAKIDVWQKWYQQGRLPDDSGYTEEHQRVLKLKPFIRRAEGEE